jgi:heat shock protein HtpX
MIDEVAREAEQPPPAEVYAVMEVNAWVAHRGGVMGLGSRPVMGLGLPLMETLSEEELRAVIAHEFGHYHGGDTKLGPWIYKTRSAIGRTIQSLGDSWLQSPFIWYGNMFLRITHAVSRNQEFCADAVAARIGGARNVITSLEKVHGAGMAFGPYWTDEVVPVLSAGYRPPIAAGFSSFLRSQTIDAAVEKALNEAKKEGKHNPYDTHPPLKERIAAVKDLPMGPESNGRASIELLDDVASLEREVLVFGASEREVKKLKEIDWHETTEAVYLPRWKELLAVNLGLLKGATGLSFLELIKDKVKLQKIKLPNKVTPPIDAMPEIASMLYSIAVILKLLEAGGEMSCNLGEPVTVHLNGTVYEPFKVFQKRNEKNNTLDAAAIRTAIEEAGWANLDLTVTAEQVAVEKKAA